MLEGLEEQLAFALILTLTLLALMVSNIEDTDQSSTISDSAPETLESVMVVHTPLASTCSSAVVKP